VPFWQFLGRLHSGRPCLSLPCFPINTRGREQKKKKKEERRGSEKREKGRRGEPEKKKKEVPLHFINIVPLHFNKRKYKIQLHYMY